MGPPGSDEPPEWCPRHEKDSRTSCWTSSGLDTALCTAAATQIPRCVVARIGRQRKIYRSPNTSFSPSSNERQLNIKSDKKDQKIIKNKICIILLQRAHRNTTSRCGRGRRRTILMSMVLLLLSRPLPPRHLLSTTSTTVQSIKYFHCRRRHRAHSRST